VQFQPELPHSLLQLLQKPLGVLPLLKPQHSVVAVADHDHVAPRHLIPPYLGPDIEYVVQVEIGKDRRDHRSLRGPFLRLEPPAVFHHARLQPFLDQAYEPWVCDPMLDELDQPLMIDPIEK